MKNVVLRDLLKLTEKYCRMRRNGVKFTVEERLAQCDLWGLLEVIQNKQDIVNDKK